MAMTSAGTAVDTLQAVRDLLEQVIKEHFPTGGHLNRWTHAGPYSVGGVTQKLQKIATERGLITDPRFWPTVVEHVWSLARVGAIALMPIEPTRVGSFEDEEARIPTFVVTELGRRLLSEPDYSPQDWAKYKAATMLRVATPDDVVVAHLHEAVLARQGALYRASLVMLGCACERLILLLADAVRDASLPPFSEKIRKLQARPKPPNISEVFDEVRRALIEAANLPPRLGDAIDSKLSPIFQYARGLRNSHGHPTGTPVEPEEADSGLRLFPGFYALADELVRHLRPHP